MINKCKDKDCRYNNELCDFDNYVHIRNSQLLCGVMDKSTLGAGSKKNVFYTILKDYGKVCGTFTTKFIFSLGLGC